MCWWKQCIRRVMHLSKQKIIKLVYASWFMKSRNAVMLILSNNLWEWLWIWTAQGSVIEYFNSQVKKVPLVPRSFAFLYCFVAVFIINVLFLLFVHHVVPKFFKFLDNVWLREGFSAVFLFKWIKGWLKAQWPCLKCYEDVVS